MGRIKTDFDNVNNHQASAVFSVASMDICLNSFAPENLFVKLSMS